jgi:class 3 adenylate cyclase
MNHFDVLKQVIAEEDGAMVKTIGDAVMAVFRQPAGALRAMLHAQQRLAAATRRHGTAAFEGRTAHGTMHRRDAQRSFGLFWIDRKPGGTSGRAVDRR